MPPQDLPDPDLQAIDAELARSTASVGFGVGDAGFVPKPFARLLAEKLVLARSVFGDDVDLTSGSALRKILEVSALEDARTWSALGAIYDNQYVSTARGEALSRLGEELGLPRPFLPARGTIRLKATLPTGTNELLIDRGARLFTDGNHHVATLELIRLTRGGGPVDVAVEAFYPGPEHNLDPTAVDGAGHTPQKITHWNERDAKLATLKAAATATGPVTTLEQVVSIEHTQPLTGGEWRWPDARYRELLLRAPRSTWTVEAIRVAASLVPGVRRVVVRDSGGLDVTLPIFGTFNFLERVFGAERDIVSPQFFTVLVAPTDAAIFDGPSGVRENVESVIEDLRPIGIYPRIEQANRVYVGVSAGLVVNGIPLPRGPGGGVVNNSDAARRFKAALLARINRYVEHLDFGEPVRAAEVTYAMMGEPGLADVQGLRLRRFPPQPGRVTTSPAPDIRLFTEFGLGENVPVGVGEIATFVDDAVFLEIV